jgi:hypothetical protein
MMGAGGMQQQPTPAQMMQLQQQHAQNIYYEQQYPQRQQQMLVYGQPGPPGAGSASSRGAGARLQYMMPSQTAAGVHVPPAASPHAAEVGRRGASVAPAATAAADVSRYQLPPTGQW